MTDTCKKIFKANTVAQMTMPRCRGESLASKSNTVSMDVAKRYIALSSIERYTDLDTREFLPHHLPIYIYSSFDIVFGASSLPLVADSIDGSKNVSELVAVIEPKAVIFLGLKGADFRSRWTELSS